jgi:hypothetical protein
MPEMFRVAKMHIPGTFVKPSHSRAEVPFMEKKARFKLEMYA